MQANMVIHAIWSECDGGPQVYARDDASIRLSNEGLWLQHLQQTY